MNRKFIILAVLCCGWAPSPMWAETLKDGPSTAYVFGGDVESPGFGFGYQVGYEFNRTFSLEVSGLWHSDKSYALVKALPTVESARAIDLDVIALALTGRVSIEPAPSLLAYAGGGIGYYILEADNQDVRESLGDVGFGFVDIQGDKDFAGHIALGCEVLLTKRWEAFAEFRYTFLDSGYTVSYSPDRNSPVGTQRDAFGYDYGAVRIGFNYRF